MPVAGHELVVGLVDVEVDGEFGFGGDDFVGGHGGGDDFVGGHGGGDSFLLGEIDLWHAGVLASLPAVCMAPECRVRLSRLPLFRVPKRAPEQSGDFMLLPELAFSFMESQKCIELGQLSAA